jgi:hypothetical protein
MPPAYLATPPAQPRRRNSDCTGKHRFETPALAHKAKGKRNWQIYRCTKCGFWHAAHQTKAPDKQARIRANLARAEGPTT